jgi:hypothetical protein
MEILLSSAPSDFIKTNLPHAGFGVMAKLFTVAPLLAMALGTRCIQTRAC